MNKSMKIIFIILAFILAAVGGFIYQLKESAKAELEKMEAEYQARPEMPISVSQRQAFLGTGFVTIFNNNSNRQLSLVATFTNPTLNTQQSFRLDIGPGSVREVGHAEGWAFSSGDIIALSHNDYKTKKIIVQ